MSIVIRAARLDDITEMVPFISLASGGISDFLLSDLVEDMSANDLIEMALVDDNTTYHFSHFIVAETAGRLIGLTHFYSSEEHVLPDLLRSMISKDKLDIIAPYFTYSVADSMYIHIMAVAESHRTSLCSVLMGKKVEDIAKTEQKKCLSAHVWRENSLVYDGLKTTGFEEVAAFVLKPQPEFIYCGEMVLMKGPRFCELI